MNPIAEIIKYEGDNSTFIWKHPCEDFNSTTQLIVHETQEALFYLNGQALDLFGPGRYTLETENIPILRKVMNLPTGGETPFHCEVYFINKTEQMAILWGTESKIEYIEPNYKFPIKIGASGEMSLRADDSRRLLIKVEMIFLHLSSLLFRVITIKALIVNYLTSQVHQWHCTKPLNMSCPFITKGNRIPKERFLLVQ